MDHLQRVIATLNKLVSQDSPETLDSTWILKSAPRCYNFIRKNVRSEVGRIDWDKITHALEPRYQRLWTPRRKRKSKPYGGSKEVSLILNKYEKKLYVFVAPADATDLQIRDKIAVALVRVAQTGNLLARAKVAELLCYTIDGWFDDYSYMSRWRGRKEEIHEQLDGCIRRYRYSGSFLRYVFRTLEYAGRGIRSLHTCSLDDLIGTDLRGRKIDNVIHDPETNEIAPYKPRKSWSSDLESPIEDC